MKTDQSELFVGKESLSLLQGKLHLGHQRRRKEDQSRFVNEIYPMQSFVARLFVCQFDRPETELLIQVCIPLCIYVLPKTVVLELDLQRNLNQNVFTRGVYSTVVSNTESSQGSYLSERS